MKTDFLFLLLIGITLNSFGQDRTGKDRALFFAVNTYEKMSSLNNPIQNAQDIATELKNGYGFEVEVVPNPKLSDIAAKIQSYQQAYRSGHYAQDGQLFIFFSGHGVKRGNNGYFMPADCDSDQLFTSGLEYDYWRSEMNDIDCKHILVVVDACYSFTFDPNWRNKSPRNFLRPGERFADQVLLNHDTYRARLFFTSDANGNQTPDHSTFANQLLAGLRKHQSPTGYLTSSELFGSYLKKAVPTPGGGDFGDDEVGSCFLFFDRGKVPPPPIPTNKMVYLQGGNFQIGSENAYDNEKPVHLATVKNFYISRFEVTFEEYDAFCLATNRSLPPDNSWGRGKLPVINISWLDAVVYCNWLSIQHRYEPVYFISQESVTANLKANGYRLPLETEWEYAARAGGRNYQWSGTSSELELIQYANRDNYSDNYGYTAPIASFKPNDLGIFDMSGNVEEWCWDSYDLYLQNNQKSKHIHKLGQGFGMVTRGGSWADPPSDIRCAYRSYSSFDHKGNTVGFRLCRTAH